MPKPPPAGISDARQARVFGSAPVIAHERNVRAATESGSTTASAALRSAWGAIISPARPSSDAGNPMWKSAPSGSATSSRKYVPIDRPVTRRTISPCR